MYTFLQLQDEIESLRAQLLDKENELAGVKEALGITAFTEFKESISNSFKVVGDKIKEVQDTETWVYVCCVTAVSKVWS